MWAKHYRKCPSIIEETKYSTSTHRNTTQWWKRYEQLTCSSAGVALRCYTNFWKKAENENCPNSSIWTFKMAKIKLQRPDKGGGKDLSAETGGNILGLMESLRCGHRREQTPVGTCQHASNWTLTAAFDHSYIAIKLIRKMYSRGRGGSSVGKEQAMQVWTLEFESPAPRQMLGRQIGPPVIATLEATAGICRGSWLAWLAALSSFGLKWETQLQ